MYKLQGAVLVGRWDKRTAEVVVLIVVVPSALMWVSTAASGNEASLLLLVDSARRRRPGWKRGLRYASRGQQGQRE